MEMQITARNLALTGAIDSAIRQEAAKLERVYPRIVGCRIVVEAENRFASGEAVFYSVRIDLTVPQGEVPTTRQSDAVLWTALQEAFDAARRRLIDFVQVHHRPRGSSGPLRP